MARRRGKSRRKRPARPREGGGRPREGEVFQRNIAALRQRDPALAKRAAEQPDPKRVRAVTTPTGALDLRVRRDDGEELALYGDDPQASLDRFLAQADLRGVSVAAVVGVGLGYELRGLQGHKDQHFRQLFVIEPDIDVFRLALRKTPLHALLGDARTHFLVGRTDTELEADLVAALMRQGGTRFVKTLSLLVSDGSLRLNGERCAAAAGALKRAAAYVVTTFGNSPQDTLMGVEHLLRNLPTTIGAAGIRSLLGRFAGRPAVVASAGPSLALQFDLLRPIQDKVLIVAPETSLRALLKQGIRPHLVTARERTPHTVKHLRDVGEPGVWLSSLMVLYPECFEVWQGAVIAVDRGTSLLPWVTGCGLDRGTVEFFGSSGNMAYRVAAELGCDPVILIGQDLAYGEGGRSHVPGTSHGFREEAYDDMEVLEVPGNVQETVKTAPNWVRFLRQYELDIAQGATVCINATEGGARIAGAHVMTFADAVREHVMPHVRESVRAEIEALVTEPTDEERLASADRVHAYVLHTDKCMQDVIDACRAGVLETQRLMAELAANGAPPVFKTLPPDLQILSGHEPLHGLAALKQRILSLPMVPEYAMAPASPMLMQWEVTSYGLQRSCADGEALLRAVLPRHVDWFEGLGGLTQFAQSLLPWGEESLHQAFPHLPPRTQPLPARSMLDIVAETSPEALQW